MTDWLMNKYKEERPKLLQSAQGNGEASIFTWIFYGSLKSVLHQHHHHRQCCCHNHRGCRHQHCRHHHCHHRRYHCHHHHQYHHHFYHCPYNRRGCRPQHCFHHRRYHCHHHHQYHHHYYHCRYNHRGCRPQHCCHHHHLISLWNLVTLGCKGQLENSQIHFNRNETRFLEGSGRWHELNKQV